MPGSSRMERLEALAQEFLAEVGSDAGGDEGRRLWPAFRSSGPGERPRRAALEAETERWSALPGVAGWCVPDVRFVDPSWKDLDRAAGLMPAGFAENLDRLEVELARMSPWQRFVRVFEDAL